MCELMGKQCAAKYIKKDIGKIFLKLFMILCEVKSNNYTLRQTVVTAAGT